jgi:hypothetical protein
VLLNSMFGTYTQNNLWSQSPQSMMCQIQWHKPWWVTMFGTSENWWNYRATNLFHSLISPKQNNLYSSNKHQQLDKSKSQQYSDCLITIFLSTEKHNTSVIDLVGVEVPCYLGFH